jgi:hypothetical protein
MKYLDLILSTGSLNFIQMAFLESSCEITKFLAAKTNLWLSLKIRSEKFYSIFFIINNKPLHLHLNKNHHNHGGYQIKEKRKS